MPPAIAGAVVGAAINAGVIGTSLIAAQIVYAAVYVVVAAAAAFAVSYVGNALFGPSKPDLGSYDLSSLAQDRTQMVRQAITDRGLIYGEVKKSGPITFLHVSEDNRKLYLMITVSGHPVDSFIKVYFGQDELELRRAEDWAAKQYAAGSYVYHDGEYYTRTSVSYPVESRPVGNDESEKFEDIVVVNQPPSTAPDLWSLVSDLSVIGAPYLVQGDYKNYAKVWTGDGTESGDAELLSAMRAAVPDLWTADHQQKGCAKIYVELTWNRDVFSAGIPNISAIVRGKKDIYDPRTGERGYTNNWALCVADYVTDDLGIGAPWDEINEDELIASANVCDEDVAIADGDMEKRYTVNGTIKTSETPKSVLEDIVSAGAGAAVWSGGQWLILAGYFRTPDTVAITEDMLVGPVRVQTRRSRADLFNAVRGTYISPVNDWQATDLPVLESDAYRDEDSGDRVYTDFEYKYTTSTPAGQRLMKIALLKCRQQIAVTLQCNLSAMRYRAGAVIPLTLPRFGWDRKLFEVVNWTLALRDNGTLGVDLIVQETDASVWDWSTSEEQIVDPAPNTNLPRPWNVAMPGAPVVTEEKYQTRAGTGIKAKAVLTWTPSATATVTEYQVEMSTHGTDVWEILPRTSVNTYTVYDVVPGTYDFRVKALTSMSSSAYSAVSTWEISGLLDKPQPLTGLTIASAGTLAILQWDQSDDLDVMVGGRVEFRHSVDVDVFGAVSIGSAVPGASTVTILPHKAGYYWVRAVDASGVAGDWVSVHSRGGGVLAYAPVANYREDADTGFPGVHDGTGFIDGFLRLGGAMLISEAPLVSTWGRISGLGGVRPSGTYTLGAGIDLQAVKSVRLTAQVFGTSVEVNDLISQRGLVSSWPSVTGAVSGVTDAQIWFRETDDNPLANPVWTDWQRLDVAEVTGRAMQFQLRLSTTDDAYAPLVSAIDIKAEVLS